MVRASEDRVVGWIVRHGNAADGRVWCGACYGPERADLLDHGASTEPITAADYADMLAEETMFGADAVDLRCVGCHRDPRDVVVPVHYHSGAWTDGEGTDDNVDTYATKADALAAMAGYAALLTQQGTAHRFDAASGLIRLDTGGCFIEPCADAGCLTNL